MYPATNPRINPIAVAMMPATKPICNETAVAFHSSVSTSRPKLSVPNGNKQHIVHFFDIDVVALDDGAIFFQRRPVICVLVGQ
jgi:hypothetical protein